MQVNTLEERGFFDCCRLRCSGIIWELNGVYFHSGSFTKSESVKSVLVRTHTDYFTVGKPPHHTEMASFLRFSLQKNVRTMHACFCCLFAARDMGNGLFCSVEIIGWLERDQLASMFVQQDNSVVKWSSQTHSALKAVGQHICLCGLLGNL